MVSIPIIKSSDELLKEAISNLRCIAWEDIDRELMRTSNAPGTGDPNALYQRSRPLRKGESIDFFMSHSWRDHPEHKFLALERVVARFKKKNGRSPTFWLDKVCIDQRSIQDGLKVLPININACRKVLVLCGDTYSYRLWCVWELFTLFAFADDAEARAKIEFETIFAPNPSTLAAAMHTKEAKPTISELVSSESVQVPRGLTHFRLSSAHCFDPNEERRLRDVIEARGVEVFENRVRELAKQCQMAIDEKLACSSSSGSLMSTSLLASRILVAPAPRGVELWRASMARILFLTGRRRRRQVDAWPVLREDEEVAGCPEQDLDV